MIVTRSQLVCALAALKRSRSPKRFSFRAVTASKTCTVTYLSKPNYTKVVLVYALW